MNMNNDNNKQDTNKIFMMLPSSILLFVFSFSILLFSFKVYDYFSFSFPKKMFFVNTKGIEDYSIDILKDKLTFILSAKTNKELDVFIPKVSNEKNIFQLEEGFKTFFNNERLFLKDFEIKNITKIYGSFKEIHGNRKIYDETSSKYRISIVFTNLKDRNDKVYYTINIVTDTNQKIYEFDYYLNENLKDFYEAVDLSEYLTLQNLYQYLDIKSKNKIFIRNLILKPAGTEFHVLNVVYTKSQNRIIVSIDHKKYALIYKKGEIINVIKI